MFVPYEYKRTNVALWRPEGSELLIIIAILDWLSFLIRAYLLIGLNSETGMFFNLKLFVDVFKLIKVFLMTFRGPNSQLIGIFFRFEKA